MEGGVWRGRVPGTVLSLPAKSCRAVLWDEEKEEEEKLLLSCVRLLVDGCPSPVGDGDDCGILRAHQFLPSA